MVHILTIRLYNCLIHQPLRYLLFLRLDIPMPEDLVWPFRLHIPALSHLAYLYGPELTPDHIYAAVQIPLLSPLIIPPLFLGLLLPLQGRSSMTAITHVYLTLLLMNCAMMVRTGSGCQSMTKGTICYPLPRLGSYYLLYMGSYLLPSYPPMSPIRHYLMGSYYLRMRSNRYNPRDNYNIGPALP